MRTAMLVLFAVVCIEAFSREKRHLAMDVVSQQVAAQKKAKLKKIQKETCKYEPVCIIHSDRTRIGIRNNFIGTSIFLNQNWTFLLLL